MHRNTATTSFFSPSITSSSSPMDPKFTDHEQQLKCPRCESMNTKFCYYNNYNLSQPRHFCKNCRRYWTKGGTLRNIPIGGGTRKITKRSSNHINKRISSSSPSPTTMTSSSPPQPIQSHIPTSASPQASSQILTMMTSASSKQKLEPEEASGFGGGGLGFSSLFGSNTFGDLLMDGLRSNLVSKSSHDDDVLIRNHQNFGGEFGGSFLRLNEEDKGNGNVNGNGGENMWPDLSIFTPGSRFQ